ncbi:hypothetical protein [Kordia sp.]|uniref:hypothetical protein n=1 Tax=Kordia sp. TaxID=1965332 RepID=UPI003D2D1228
MKKKYLLIIGALLFLFIGGSFAINPSKDFTNQNKVEIGKNDKLIPQEVNKQKKNTLTVKLKKNKDPISHKLIYSEIEVYNEEKEKIGSINLFTENPYLQYKLGNRQINPFQVNNAELAFSQTHLDRNIAYRTTFNDKIPNHIGVTYTAKSSDFNYSSSVIKVYNQFGDVIFDSDVLYDKNYMLPSISPNGKYLAVYSSIYEDETENYRLINENKIDFFDLQTNTKIQINNNDLNLDLAHGSFNENNLFITTKKSIVSIIDIKAGSYYLGNRDTGQHITAVRNNEEIKIYTVNNLNKDNIKDVTNNFQKHSL